MAVLSAEEYKLKVLQEVQEKRYKVLKELEDDPFLGYKTIEDAYADYKVTSNVEVLARMLNRENLFISGPAGSGKTTIIKKFMSIVDAESEGTANIALTASTGIASKLINGKTIHSWSGLGINTEPLTDENIKEFLNGENGSFLRGRIYTIKKTDVLIIDEISMLPAYFFSNLNTVLKYAKNNKKPFGGIQIIVTGDFQQLPPVDKDKNLDNRFVFFTDAWKEADFNFCYMDKLHRATDKRLQYVLESISRGKVDDKTRRLINSRMEHNLDSSEKPEFFTTLYTTNKNVDSYNKEQMDLLPEKLQIKKAVEHGAQKKVQKIYKDNNVQKELELKVGAIVMVTTNLSSSVPNGFIGKIVNISRDIVAIISNDGKTHFVGRRNYTLEEDREGVGKDGNIIKYKDVVATVSQFPLRAAWAITVHKSQGQLFNGVYTDLSNCFTKGLGYVALSRVRNLDDLIIKKFSEKAYEIDEKAREITKEVKHGALSGRKEFIKNEAHYVSLLSYSLYRKLEWGDVESNKD